jgi:hypothetical protein
LDRDVERKIIVNILSFRYLGILVLVLALLPTGRAQDAGRRAEKDGTLVVLVTWGDVDNTPANDVYVLAHSFVVKDGLEKSFVFKMSHAGRYEASLSPGVYDVFVSEGTSIPRCRRVLITADYTGYWRLKLEHDDVYLQK